MVVEVLTFEVDPAERDEWLEVEGRTWSAALRARPGFVRKEIWLSDGDPGRVHAVIWWTDRESWKSMTDAEVAAVDRAMGEWYREPAMRELRVIREG